MHLQIHLVLLPLFINFVSSTVAAPPPSLAAALSFTTREQLSSHGDRIAWVEITRGVPNVFAARASEGWLPTQLTRYTTDRCKSINLFGWWSATLLHFSVEMRDESNGMNIVDPLHSGEGLYAVSAFPNGSLPVLVSPLPIATAEHGRLLYSRVVTPAPSDAFAFSIAQIEIATLVPSGLAIDANGWTKLLTVLQGTIEEMVWAPDGAMLAFTNVRGDHGFLGVVAFANATTLLSDAIAWVAPSHDTDAGPRWSHDGTRLAWRRERDMVGVDGRDQRCVKGGYCGRTGAAYSLMVASVRKEDEASAVVSVADVRTLFSDFITGWANGEAGYGSRPMDWSADGSELFFPCETSGYVHVAAVAVPPPASAAVKHAVKLQKLPRDLTSLPCDNQAWSLHTSTATGTAQTLYVVHNCDNVDSMGIAAIDVVTGKRTVVIAAAPTRVVGMTTTLGLAHVDAGLIFVETTWSNSTVLRLLPTGAPAGSLGTLLTPSPSSSRFDGSAFVTPSLVTFPSHDGLTVHAQLFEPAASEGGSNTTPRPAVVFTHGGSQRQMYASFHFGECYAQLYALNQHLASLGFVVLSINYRCDLFLSVHLACDDIVPCLTPLSRSSVLFSHSVFISEVARGTASSGGPRTVRGGRARASIKMSSREDSG